MSATWKVLQGDCIEVMGDMESGSFELIFADPPYHLSNGGFSVQSGKQVSVDKGQWDRSAGTSADFDFHQTWIRECLRLLTANGSLVISGTYHSIYSCGTILQQEGARIINELVWFKPNGAPALGGRNFTASHETLIWASKSPKSKHTFNYQESKTFDHQGDALKNPGKQMRSVWSIPAVSKSEKKHGGHPTQKPIRLLERIVSLCSNPGDRVLDPFCGSGTTGVAALHFGRNFVGMEQDSTYIDLSTTRMAEIL
jgi:site-specific DNA-methyltransferase (adenine-specific)